MPDTPPASPAQPPEVAPPPLAAASSAEKPPDEERPQAFPHTSTGGAEKPPLFEFTPSEGMSPTELNIYKQVFDALTDSLSKRLAAVEKDCTLKLQSLEQQLDLARKAQPPEAEAVDSTPKGPKPANPKDIDKPFKYTGNADHWMRWSRSSKRFLQRIEFRWADILKLVEDKRGNPVLKSDEAAWAEKLELGEHMPAFKDQLCEMLECYTDDNQGTSPSVRRRQGAGRLAPACRPRTQSASPARARAAPQGLLPRGRDGSEGP